MLRVTVRFPLGVYHAQSATDFARAEWPPHPVRLIAALTAAAHGGGDSRLVAARDVIGRVAAADPPRILAPRAAEPADANGSTHVARLRGASRWAPRNHELAELRGGKGISPRDPGRGRAEVHKVGVALGDAPVAFEWPHLVLDDEEADILRGLAQDTTVLGTARSPVVVEIETTESEGDGGGAWLPTEEGEHALVAQVRVPNARTLADLDEWHARRGAPLRRDGAPPPTPYIPPMALGHDVSYVHDRDAESSLPTTIDPKWWGDMLVVAVDRETSEALPKAPATFALARAMRKAVLDTYEPKGSDEEAPPVLRGRGAQPHLAFVPLSFVAQTHRRSTAAGSAFADGRTIGIAVVLPHDARVPDIALQRLAVERGLRALVLGPDGGGAIAVRVPGVGSVRLRAVPTGRQVADTLREARYRRAADRWSTVTPLVHSRYRPRRGEAALYEQVTAECADVGLPAPARVAVRRVARFRGAPQTIDTTNLPESWTGPLRGPQAHLDLWFDVPVRGPVLLGRARHFGLGLCLPFEESPEREP